MIKKSKIMKKLRTNGKMENGRNYDQKILNKNGKFDRNIPDFG